MAFLKFKKFCQINWNHVFMSILTIENFYPIWISRSFKKGASDNTISYFDQSFCFSGLWLILARNLGRSGQNKLWGIERELIIYLKKFQQCSQISMTLGILLFFFFVLHIEHHGNVSNAKLSHVWKTQAINFCLFGIINFLIVSLFDFVQIHSKLWNTKDA